MTDFVQRAKDFTMHALLLGKKMISEPPALILAKTQSEGAKVAPPCRNCMGSRFIYSQGSMHFCWMCMDKTLQ